VDDILPYSSLLRKKPFFDLLEPSPMAPISAFTRDPWWYPSYAPYIPSYAQYRTPFYLRDSYLSPIKRAYLWSRHPIRPFGMCTSPFVALCSERRTSISRSRPAEIDANAIVIVRSIMDRSEPMNRIMILSSSKRDDPRDFAPSGIDR